MTQLKSFLMLDKNLFYIVNIMGADVLVTQGARASATVIFNYVEPD